MTTSAILEQQIRTRLVSVATLRQEMLAITLQEQEQTVNGVCEPLADQAPALAAGKRDDDRREVPD